MKNTVIFDLDGTLALIDHRRHLVEKGKACEKWWDTLTEEQTIKYMGDALGHFQSATGWKPNWDAFYEACDHDLPNEPVIMMLGLLALNGYRILILSGRSEVVREKTEVWLRKYRVNYDKIYMRKAGSYIPDEQLKKIWLDEIGKDKVYCVFDDRDKVVCFWRGQGITCFQVAEGNF
jgi:phosphoglycolate phosphatase-like HAD superfamily hydrolase